MNESRRTTLQQPNISRAFVNVPSDFVKKLRWAKGQELTISLEDDKIIIQSVWKTVK